MEKTSFINIVNTLNELSEKIDGSPSISIGVEKFKNFPPRIMIKFKWNSGFTCERVFAFSQINGLNIDPFETLVNAMNYLYHREADKP